MVLKLRDLGDFAGGPVVRTPSFHSEQGAWVHSQVGELRSCKPQAQP